MKRTKPQRPAPELIDLAALLLFVQGVVAIVATFEVGLVAAFTGGIVLPIFLLTATGAVGTMVLVRGLRRRSRAGRTITVTLQVLWLLSAAIDLLLAIVLARRGLEPVPTLTRIVLPLALFRILRRPQVREAFGAKPSRRQRRKARKAAEAEATAEVPELVGAAS